MFSTYENTEHNINTLSHLYLGVLKFTKNMSITQPLFICMEDQEMKEVKERSVKLLTVMHFQENQKHNAICPSQQIDRLACG